MAASFKDSEGREWTLSLNLKRIAAVKVATGVNLSSMAGLEAKAVAYLLQVAGDPVLLFGVITTLIEGQLKEQKLTADDFADGIEDFGVVDEMTRALIECCIAFMPEPGRSRLRDAFVAVWKSAKCHADESIKAALEKFDSIDLDKWADELLSKSLESGKAEVSASVE